MAHLQPELRHYYRKALSTLHWLSRSGIHIMAEEGCEHKPDVGMHDPLRSVTPRRGAPDSAPPWQPCVRPYPPEGRGVEASASSSYMPAR